MIRGKRLYSAIRAHGLITHLLSYKELLTLTGYEDLEQILSELAKTDYGRFFKTKEDLVDDREIERKINKLMFERLSLLLSIMDKKMAELVQAYLLKYDLERLRKAIYAKRFHQKLEEFTGYEFFPGINQLIEALETKQMPSHPRVRPILNYLREWERTGDAVLLEMLLESYYANMLLQRIRSWTDKKVKDPFLEYLKERLVLVSLKAVFCGQNDKLSVIRRFLDPDAYNILSTAKDFETAIKQLSTIEKYSSLAKKMIEFQEKIQRPLLWEFIHLSHMLEKAASAARRDPTGPLYIFWYVFRTEWEAEAIKVLILGKKREVPSHILQEIFGLFSYLSKYEDSHQ